MSSNTSSLKPISRALISVSDKAGILDFAKALAALDIEIVSTGGTAKIIAEAGIAFSDDELRLLSAAAAAKGTKTCLSGISTWMRELPKLL